MNFLRSCVSVFFLVFSFSFFSCNSTSSISQNKPDFPKIEEPQNSSITMLFAGDIMAHEINFKAQKFERIWQDVKPLVKSCDLAFANIEAPVNSKHEWSTYPQFNMHPEYVQAAIDSGFNVFSLANNHTNDWYLDGINATRNYFEKKTDVFACGIKSNPSQKLTFQIIEKNGWKILFAAVTEILNRPDYASWIDYFPPKKHSQLIEELKEIQSQNEHDIFVLSVHTDEEEYKKNVTESHKKFFRQLIEECKVDVIWANHPHVYKTFETVTISDGKTEKNAQSDSPSTKTRKAFIMYANGNTISGQRSSPSLTKTANARDDTGDGLFIKMTFEKTSSQVSIKQIEPHFITSYIQPDGQIVLRLADDDFIHCLKRSGLFYWAKYIESRKKIYENTKGNSLWQ